MTTIYLSSTYKDLVEHRSFVFEDLRKNYKVIAMEDYVATDNRPVEECLKDIGEHADIYLGIFGFRYGYVPPVEHIQECRYTAKHADWQGLSITELEFRYAKEEARIPCLVFVAKEGASWPLEFHDAISERNKEKNPGDRIYRLREYLLRERLASEFSSPQELARLAQAAVTKHLQSPGRRGAEKTVSVPEVTWDINQEGSPYPGLMHFTRKYAPVFFGREAEVSEILERLSTHRTRFMLVSGDSGVGKSSLVDAGLLPVLEERGLPGGQDCMCVRMVPRQGRHPFDALMKALSKLAKKAKCSPKALGEALCKKPIKLPARVGQIISKSMVPSALVLFLDQMEELFTGQASDHADAFLSALYAAAQEEILWVIATIRSDYLQHCHRHPDLLKVLRGRGHYPLGHVDATVIAEMIKKPAQCAGLEIAGRLVRRLAQESGSKPGSLPLLAFVLQRLFDERDGVTLDEEVYKRFGGVDGAIVDHVKTVESKLPTKIKSNINILLPKLFRVLLVVDQEGLPTRRRALLSGLAKDFGPLVDSLIKARLLCTEGEGADSTVSVAHERLFKAWPALDHWIEENKDELRVLRQAETEAREWEKNKFDLVYLWHTDRLKKLHEIVRRLDSPTISDAVRNFAEPQHTLIERLNVTAISHQERMNIGLCLAELGDPRHGVGLRKDGLPDIVWCEVLGGKIEIKDKELDKTFIFNVEPFFIAKYPVTWIQYRSFRETEYEYREKYWRKTVQLLTKKYEPCEQYRKIDNHPAENLSWYEAKTFCCWLTEKLGYEVRLPSEWEWQQAAACGDPENTYPWGTYWDSTKANTSESKLSRTIAVGMYPHGASQRIQALDMSGNVAEWCLNTYSKPKESDDFSGGSRAARGGSWYLAREFARCDFRGQAYPDDCFPSLGFRLACTSPNF